MFVARSTLVVTLCSSLLGLVTGRQQEPATPTTTKLPEELLNAIDKADQVALHAALHESHPSFAHGTHENDIAAVQAVHRDNPALATRIVELARRQFSNSTTTRAPAAGQSTAVYLTTYTAQDGKAVTVTAITVIGVGATNGAQTTTHGASGTPNADSGGQLQSWGEPTAQRPWDGLGLSYQAIAIAALLGFVGMA